MIPGIISIAPGNTNQLTPVTSVFVCVFVYVQCMNEMKMKYGKILKTWISNTQNNNR